MKLKSSGCAQLLSAYFRRNQWLVRRVAEVPKTRSSFSTHRWRHIGLGVSIAERQNHPGPSLCGTRSDVLGQLGLRVGSVVRRPSMCATPREYTTHYNEPLPWTSTVINMLAHGSHTFMTRLSETFSRHMIRPRLMIL